MKKVDVFLANTLIDSFNQCLLKSEFLLDDKFNNNIIIVPDKFSLNAERSIFDVLKIDSTFNIDVVSFNRLCYKVLNFNSLDVISKRQGLIKIGKILLQNKDKIKTFNNLIGTYGLTENIYETIMQFKSSNIAPSELITNDNNSHLKNKLEDIKLIYELYEKEIDSGTFDEVKRLQFLANSIGTNNYVCNSNVIVAMFDSFTNLQLMVLESIIKNAKSVTFALSANTFQNNSSCYVNETLQQVLQTINSAKSNSNIINCKVNDNDIMSHLKRNLFSPKKVSKLSCDNVVIYQSKNKKEEFEFVAKKIKELVKLNNYSFKDINIAVADLQNNRQLIEEVFSSYNLPCYFDVQNNASNNLLFKFVKTLCRLNTNSLDIKNILNFVKSDFVACNQSIKDELELVVNKYGIDRIKFEKPLINNKDINYQQLEEFRKSINNFVINFKNEISNCKTSEQFSLVLKNSLEALKVSEYLETLSKNNSIDAINQKNTENAYQKLMDILTDIDAELLDAEISFENYEQLLFSLIDAETFKGIPLYSNSVFIGDALSSYFYKEKVLFICNAVEGLLPNYKTDCGLITDNEINLLKSKNRLSPSINQINKREKFKLLNLASNFNDFLFVSYSLFDNNVSQKPSELVIAIQKIFCGDNLNLNKENYLEFLNTKYDNNLALLIDTGTEDDVIIKRLSNKTEDDKLSEKDCNNNEKLFNILSFKKQFNIKNLSYNKNMSVSKIESYNCCPFKYFCNYVLKIKEPKQYGLEPIDVGTILHYVAQKFVELLIKTNYQLLTDSEITKIAQKIYFEVLNFDKYKEVDSSSILIKTLEQESDNLCKVIYYQMQNSNFKPKKAEFKFENYKLSDDLYLSGIVDRIDQYGNYFNIIDYKTGNCDFNFEDVFVGKKIQIFVYAYILQKVLNIKQFGCFYMPISNKFVKDKEKKFEKYKLSGVMLNNEELIKNQDIRLKECEQSDIIDVAFNKNGELSNRKKSNLLNQGQLDAINQYAIDNAIKTSSFIKQGLFKPNPLQENDCKYCPYSAICEYSQQSNGFRTLKQLITKQTFKKEE